MSQPTRHPVAAKASDGISEIKFWKNLFWLTSGGSNRDGSIPHAGKIRDPDMFFVIKNETVVLLGGGSKRAVKGGGSTYDFIGHHEKIELIGQPSDSL